MTIDPAQYDQDPGCEEWNWYLPSWLEWLPRLDHGESTGSPVVLPPVSPATDPVS